MLKRTQGQVNHLFQVITPQNNNIWNLTWQVGPCHKCSLWYSVAATDDNSVNINLTYAMSPVYELAGHWMYKAQPGQNIECCLQYLSTKSCIHSSTFPSRKRERNATLFFPCSLAKVASFCIPSTSPSAECSSSKPLKSTACLRHSSATSNCASWPQHHVRRFCKFQV